MRRSTRHILPFVLLLSVGRIVAQSEIRFQQITTEDGLSDNGITCLLEDREGYVWVGTERGLQRYDGQRMEHFKGPGWPGLAHISALALDSAGNVWAASTDAGLFRYSPAARSFIHLRHTPHDPHSLPTDNLNHVLALNDSILVLCSQNAGVIWYNGRSGTWRSNAYNLDTTLTSKDGAVEKGSWCHTTTRLDNDRVWLGLIPGGNSFVIDAWTGKELTEVRSAHVDSLYSLSNAILLDGDLIAGGWGPGLTRIPIESGHRQSYIPLPDEITAMVPWDGDKVLAGTKINGLILLGPDLHPLMRFRHQRGDPTSLINDRVRCVMKDRQGNLWVGTAGGLSVHAPSVWRMSVRSLFPPEKTDQPDLTFHNLQQETDGTIRISTSHGFFTFKDARSAPKHIPLEENGHPLEVTGLFHTGKDTWCVGTETGLFRYDRQREAIPTAYKEAIRPFKQIKMYQVRSVLLDTIVGKPALVVGALGFATTLFDPMTMRSLPSSSKRAAVEIGPLIYCTVRDAKGSYWSGTDKGIYRWSIKGQSISDMVDFYGREEPDGHKLPSDQVSALKIHGATVWAAMRDGALVAITGGAATFFQAPRHIATDLFGITFDRDGNAWCTTGNGLACYNTASGSWIRVPVNDGKIFRQLNGAIITLQNGNIAFCADNSLITFDPAAYNNLPPVPVPELIIVKNSWGSLTPNAHHRVELSYRDGSFEAELTALNTVGTGPLEFIYRVEGVEQEARATTAEQPLRYAGMPIGEHRLLVRTRDAYGRLGPERALLTLAIAGPFWHQWWFYALIALALAAVVWAWTRYTIGQAIRMQAVRDGIARDLHDDVGSTLGSISYYSEALKRRIGAGDVAAQEVADKIGQSSREMIDRMGDIVWSIDPRNDSAGSLEERTRAYATNLLAAHGVELSFPATQQLNNGPLDTRTRRTLFLIFKEALNNALKYSGCTLVEVELRQEGRQLRLEVIDNGCGFDLATVQPYNGNGLRGMATRAESIGGTTTVRSTPASGTVIVVQVPIGKGIPRTGDKWPKEVR